MLRRVEPSRTPPSITDLQKPLEHFRAKTQRLRIHPLELSLLGVVCAHLIFLVWALGGRPFWAQLTSLGFGVVELALALRSRHYTAEFSAEGTFKLVMWPKLVRFPLFGTGLALLVYILIQALNPAWRYVSDQRGWWMEPASHVTWLPSGTIVPFAIAGQWRSLIVYTAVWLLVCSIWTGFTRRRTLQFFFIVLAANAMVLALFGLVQRLTTNGLIFWFWKPPASYFFASFTYKNHAGAYFNLMLAICIGLAGWFYLRSLRRLEKSNPAGLFVFFSVLIAIDVVITFSRASTILMLLYLTLAMVIMLVYQLKNPQLLRRPVVTFILLCGFSIFAYVGLDALNVGQAWDKMKQSESDGSVVNRWVTTKASSYMLKDHWEFGTGAGSYRFLFPPYQNRYAEITMSSNKRSYYEHAHNDWLEFPIELGLFGGVMILLSLGHLALKLMRSFFWENPLTLMITLGGLLILAYSSFDFIFQNVAILTTWCALWPAVLHWTEFEDMNLPA